MDEERRRLLALTEEKKNNRNALGKSIGIAKKKGQPTTEIDQLLIHMHQLDLEIEDLDSQVSILSDQIDQILVSVPNLPHSSVPDINTFSLPHEARHWGTPREFPWEPKSHRDIGKDLKVIDWGNGTKPSEIVSPVYWGAGAKLKRAVVQYSLNQLETAGYLEAQPANIMDQTCISKCGCNPEEARHFVKLDTDQFLAPYATLPLISIFQDTILKGSDLPVLHSTSLTCIQMHSSRTLSQFLQLGLIGLTTPELSYPEMEKMVFVVETILQNLGLPYRVLTPSATELKFSAAKTYIIKIWMPNQNSYVEVASITNSEAFIARRLGIRFRNAPKEKPQHVHTLDCILLIDQLIASLLENDQNDDGSVQLPTVLHAFAGTDRIC